MNVFNIFILLSLILLSIVDIKKREINPIYSYGLIVIILIYQFITNNIVLGLLGLLTGFIAAYVLCEIDFWGGGDGKILIAIGTLLGPVLLFIFLFLTFLIGFFWKWSWSLYFKEKSCPFIPVFLISFLILNNI